MISGSVSRQKTTTSMKWRRDRKVKTWRQACMHRTVGGISFSSRWVPYRPTCPPLTRQDHSGLCRWRCLFLKRVIWNSQEASTDHCASRSSCSIASWSTNPSKKGTMKTSTVTQQKNTDRSRKAKVIRNLTKKRKEKSYYKCFWWMNGITATWVTKSQIALDDGTRCASVLLATSPGSENSPKACVFQRDKACLFQTKNNMQPTSEHPYVHFFFPSPRH